MKLKGLFTLIALFGLLSSLAQTDNQKMFEPEFYAYRYGRVNNENGEGEKWYKRFCLFHITDIHNRISLLKEAINVAQTKADIIINTGDDCNGCTIDSRNSNLEILNAVHDTVIQNNKIPYIDIPGNHDVPGITKREYFERISQLVQKYSPSVSWGDSTGYRSYGYLDVKSNDQMGIFRIIMLDPFDYDDGDFSVKRKFMTATFSQKQIDWFIKVLKETSKLDGYHIITAMHYSFGDNSLKFSEEIAKPDAEFYQDAFMIPDIIDAVQNKATLNKVYKDKLGEKDITINEDFHNVGNIDYICHLFGHIHSRNTYWCQSSSKKYHILMLGENALGVMGTRLNKMYREQGTVNEISFSALLVDTKEKCIYRTSYGAYLKYDMSGPNSRTEKIYYGY